MDKDRQPFEHEQDSSQSHVNEHDDIRVDVAEEELTATTRGVDRGSVTVEKDIVSEEQTLDVPVTEERVNVTRRTVDRDVSAGDESITEGSIEVPVYGEEVDVQKRSRVTEELEINKEAVQDTQRVTGTVRREEVSVDGDVVESDSATGSDDRGLIDKAPDALAGDDRKRRST